MSQIKIIATDLDIQPILHQVLDNPHDWQMVSGLAKNNPNKIGGDQEPPGFLPLTMGVASPGEDIKNSEKQKNTPIYTKYTQVHHFWKTWGIREHSRAAFFKLKPGGRVGTHIDDGKYYLLRDRYHLALQGNYMYHVGDEELIVPPGTFFWFNNKIPHGAYNFDDVDRISLVFDVPHSPSNPQHKLEEVSSVFNPL
jgi:mannose-6-phosphate isomerase-like protein (cupin superfamily)